MEPLNKRRKLDQSYTPFEEANPDGHAKHCLDRSQTAIRHDGIGIQDINGTIRIGGDFGTNTDRRTHDHGLELSPKTRSRRLMESLAFTQMSSRRSTVKTADSTTCEWLLQHPAFVDWRNPAKRTQNYGFLWIHGKPGAGKSTLMKFIYKEMAKFESCASFFFNAGGDELEKSTIGMHRSLLLQLLEEFTDLQVVLQDRNVFHEWQRGGLQWTTESLQDLFTNTIEQLGRRRLQFTCFIDALDECDDQQVQEMVAYLEDVGRVANEHRSTLYTCFSSRHYPTINIQCGLQLTLEDQPGHGKDMAKYVQKHLQAGQGKNQEEVEAHILRKANGIFMWAILVVKILNEEYRRGRIFAIRKRLQEIPTELSGLFKDLLRRDHTNMPDLLLCLQWIDTLRKTTAELRRVLFRPCVWSGP